MVVGFNEYCIVKVLSFEVSKTPLKCENCPFFDKCEQEAELIKVGYSTHKRMIEQRDERIKELEKEVNFWKGSYIQLNALFSKQK